MIRSISAEPRFRDSRPWADSACQGATHHLGDRLRGQLFQMLAPERQLVQLVGMKQRHNRP